MKILVTGALGMLGAELVRFLKTQPTVTGIVQRDIDDLPIEQEKVVVPEVKEIAPDLLINCAAYTDVDGCESKHALAVAANAAGPGNLAKAVSACGARLIHISTDFVFDGKKTAPYTEEDAPNPLSVYGRSKLEGERLIAEHCGDYAILRTAWLYGEHGKNFVDTITRLGREKEELKVVSDEIGSPTWTHDLVEAIWAVVTHPACTGVFHASNSGHCSRFEQAQRIVGLTGGTAVVRPTTAEEYGLPAPRPSSVILDTTKLTRATGYRMRNWEVAMGEYLAKAGDKS
ncbi:MAG: dTDP-4-dehydrorhamnose reductase [Planctomycetes bacterium]|nr:dTDP-4-dehydrorhamnose reductase [Planctomycetota bacterium]